MNSFSRSFTVPVLVVLSLALITFGCGSSGGGGKGPGIPSIQVAKPAVDRPSGYFVDPIDVTISPGTAGTFGDTIVYTTDGSDPSCDAGPAYASTTVTINSVDVDGAVTTIKAVACMDSYDDSDVLVATYTELVADTRVNSGAGLSPIQDAINAAATGDVIYIEPGTYTENNGQVTINKRVTLIGAGRGDDPATNTIINSNAPLGINPIHISTGGASATSRVAIRNLKVTGSLGKDGGGNGGGGIEIGTIDGHIEFDNVASVGNSGNGIHLNVSGSFTQDIVIRNSDLSFNGNHGFRNPSSVGYINGLLIDNTTFEGNTGAGIMFYDDLAGAAGSPGFLISNSTFDGNAANRQSLGDIVFSGFNGNGTFSTVSIVGNASESGIRISGNKDSGTNLSTGTAGNLTLSNVNISGVQQSSGTYPSGAIIITRYLGLSNVTMSNVELGSTAPNGLFLGTISAAGSTVSGPGLGPDLGDLLLSGTFSVADIKLGSHGNSGSYDLTDITIDARGVTFQGALDNVDVEDRIYHWNDDTLLGLVVWTTP